MEVLKRPEVTLETLRPLVDGWPEASSRDEESAEVEVKYAGYVARDRETLERVRRTEEQPLPANLDYERVEGLTVEVRQLLARARPLTLGQALRLPGMRPASATAILVHLRRRGAT